ncbi:MAG TPA: DUF2007 domain-containing protein [Flavisolibacter sp.]|nr:DUF2007 domain-containing protein [Flavisolibacter sp.]
MNYVVVQIFTNYVEAHIVKGRLEASGINCFLRDEHLSALIVDPVLTGAIAGIKLLVPEDQFDKAIQILNEPEEPISENEENN